MEKAGGGLIGVIINLDMSWEAPTQPVSNSEAARANHGHPIIRYLEGFYGFYGFFAYIMSRILS